MKITLITPAQFKQIPWKNGKGVTTELSISPNSDLTNFDWRLSIATVSENGAFSDFAGYLRNLILLEGEGIELIHDQQKHDKLTTPLSFATFDGGNKTIGQLTNGTIKDFNLMTRLNKYQVQLETWREYQQQTFELAELTFIYSHYAPLEITLPDCSTQHLPKQHLAIVKHEQAAKQNILITGEQAICITLNSCA